MMDSYLDFVDISFEGRSLQMRPSQLTTTNIARAFRLIPDTIILVSDRGTVALPPEVFDDVDECYTWTVEGDKATNGGGNIAARAPKSGVERWKPKTFQPSISTTTSHSVRKQVGQHEHECMHACTKDCMLPNNCPPPPPNSVEKKFFIEIPILYLSVSCPTYPKSGQIGDFVEGLKIVEM
jgi:hypothetical protein